MNLSADLIFIPNPTRLRLSFRIESRDIKYWRFAARYRDVYLGPLIRVTLLPDAHVPRQNYVRGPSLSRTRAAAQKDREPGKRREETLREAHAERDASSRAGPSLASIGDLGVGEIVYLAAISLNLEPRLRRCYCFAEVKAPDGYANLLDSFIRAFFWACFRARKAVTWPAPFGRGSPFVDSWVGQSCCKAK